MFLEFMNQHPVDTSVLSDELASYMTQHQWSIQGMQGDLPSELDANLPANKERMEHLRDLIEKLRKLPDVHRDYICTPYYGSNNVD